MSELDDLQALSKIEDEPLFSLKNIFKPTAKNIVIWCTIVKAICAGVVTSCVFMIANDPHYYALLVLGCVLIGGAAEGLVLFTKQDPLSTLQRAAEDIKINPQQAIDALTKQKKND